MQGQSAAAAPTPVLENPDLLLVVLYTTYPIQLRPIMAHLVDMPPEVLHNIHDWLCPIELVQDRQDERTNDCRACTYARAQRMFRPFVQRYVFHEV